MWSAVLAVGNKWPFRKQMIPKPSLLGSEQNNFVILLQKICWLKTLKLCRTQATWQWSELGKTFLHPHFKSCGKILISPQSVPRSSTIYYQGWNRFTVDFTFARPEWLGTVTDRLAGAGLAEGSKGMWFTNTGGRGAGLQLLKWHCYNSAALALSHTWQRTQTHCSPSLFFFCTVNNRCGP